MLTGSRAFKRNSSAETMTAILREEPPEISGIGVQVPPGLQRLLSHCLEKDPKQRFQSAKDLSFALENVNAGTSTAQIRVGPTQSKVRKIRTAIFAVLGVVALVACGLVAHALLGRRVPVEFTQITFGKGWVGSARFTQDSHMVVYTAALNGPAVKIYSARDDGSDVRDLGVSGDVEAISRSGEIAVILSSGTLVRVPLSGGAPRELLENVVAADWLPDGTHLAVAVQENGKCRIEYPLGKMIYETIGCISNMRVAPQGDAVAFMEHPDPSDDRGTVVVIDTKGRKHADTREWTGEYGLAWTPDGNEVMFTATGRTENDRDLYAVSRSGKQRLVYRAPGGLWLEDVSTDGRILLQHKERRYEVVVGRIGGEARLLSSLQIMALGSVSRDGKYAVMTDMSGNGGRDYRIYFGSLDGAPSILLGSGIAGGISPDNKWVASILPSDTGKVLLLPTGVGETKTVSAPAFVYSDARWASDSRSLVVRASRAQQSVRYWVEKIEDNTTRPVTPEGVDFGRLLTLGNSDYIGARDATTKLRLYPVNGGNPREVFGISEKDELIGAGPGSDDVYVSSDRAAISREIVKVNIVTGTRQSVGSISPIDPAGLLGLGLPVIMPDQKTYVCAEIRAFSVLYVATGLN
jgi:WD40 repeat protein